MPIVVLVSGKTKLRDMFCAMAHAFFVEAGKTFASLRHFVDGINTLTSDFGVEFSLVRVENHSIVDLLPWYPSDLLLFQP